MSLSPPPEPDMAALREVFNRVRADRAQTFDQLAELTGLSRRTLLNISSGTTIGDLRTWLILAKVWRIPLDELFAPVWGAPIGEFEIVELRKDEVEIIASPPRSMRPGEDDPHWPRGE